MLWRQVRFHAGSLDSLRRSHNQGSAESSPPAGYETRPGKSLGQNRGGSTNGEINKNAGQSRRFRNAPKISVENYVTVWRWIHDVA